MAKAVDKIKGVKEDIHVRGYARSNRKGDPLRSRKKGLPPDWEPIVMSPRVTEAMQTIVEVLSDGKEHSIADLRNAQAANKSPTRYIYDALKLLPEVESHNHGRGGSFYRLRNPEKPAEEKKKDNPAVAKSVDIIVQKDDKRSVQRAALRDRVEDVLPGYDPVVSIAEIANDPSVPIAIRLECHRDVARYTTPQVKAVEITSEDQPVALSFKWQD
jgi:hypothetical protein